MFLETEASPENLKRNEKDPKKKPNTSKTQIKTSKIDPNNKQFLDHFLNSFGPQTGSQNCSKTEANYCPFFCCYNLYFHKHTIFTQLKCRFETQFGPTILHTIQINIQDTPR